MTTRTIGIGPGDAEIRAAQVGHAKHGKRQLLLDASIADKQRPLAYNGEHNIENA